MPDQPKPKPKRMTPAEQSQRFKDTARELGADESPEAFERVLKRVAPNKPAPKPGDKPKA